MSWLEIDIKWMQTINKMKDRHWSLFSWPNLFTINLGPKWKMVEAGSLSDTPPQCSAETNFVQTLIRSYTSDQQHQQPFLHKMQYWLCHRPRDQILWCNAITSRRVGFRSSISVSGSRRCRRVEWCSNFGARWVKIKVTDTFHALDNTKSKDVRFRMESG